LDSKEFLAQAVPLDLLDLKVYREMEDQLEHQVKMNFRHFNFSQNFKNIRATF